LTVAALGSVEVVLRLTGVSLASFLLGALIFGHLGHFMGEQRFFVSDIISQPSTSKMLVVVLKVPFLPRTSTISAR